jgi:hypothetical protein
MPAAEDSQGICCRGEEADAADDGCIGKSADAAAAEKIRRAEATPSPDPSNAGAET